jgi:hypothetical protein
VIGRILATLGIAALLVVDLVLPSTDVGRRGTSSARDDVPTAAPKIGEKMPPFSLEGLDGRAIRNADLLGHRVLITFERSVDW